AISGATSASFTINPVAAGDAGAYDVVVSSSCGTATSSAATLAVNTCAAEMDVQGNAVSILAGNVTPSTADLTDFGSADLTSGSVDHTFTIANLGDVNLNLTGTPTVQLIGPNAADFSVTVQPASLVAPGRSTTFTLHFDPSATGLRSVTVSIANNDANENPYDFVIQGTGTDSLNNPPWLGVQLPTVTVDEGSSAGNTGTWSDLDNDVVAISASVGTVGVSNGLWSWQYATVDGPVNSQTVTLTANDGQGNSTTATFALVVNNVAPAVTIHEPASGFLQTINTPLTFTGSFTDPGVNDSHTARWIVRSAAVPETVIPATIDGGTVTTAMSFPAPGVYTVKLEVADNDGGVAEATTVENDLPAYVVVYDPNGGFVTGGGWVWSPAGALVVDPDLEGKATFGFVAKYKKGAQVPEGNTEFQFKASELNFSGSVYQWLVVSGSLAQFKGSGTINGEPGYGFMLTAIDGQINGGGGSDRFRLKIWHQATGVIIYDNQIGTSDDAGLGDSTILGGGSIVIHSASKK
ncbi:MAG: choice-of-anchor D domain-containing protein, partial [Verrucomicrobiales bacterium]|nr:choice-of-anchor D domain-containing protein [Verrucomicrobiales bacterium]